MVYFKESNFGISQNVLILFCVTALSLTAINRAALNCNFFGKQTIDSNVYLLCTLLA